MPLKLHAGVSKKMGLPSYGSLGASCHVEVDLDGSLLGEDLDAFHQRVQDTFIACAQAVNDELARHQAASAVAERVTSAESPSITKRTSAFAAQRITPAAPSPRFSRTDSGTR